MKQALTIVACIFYASLDAAHAQQMITYTTYIAGKPAVVDQWTATTEDGTLKTVATLGAPGTTASQRAVTIAVNHRPKSFALLAGENELVGADFSGATVKLRVHGQPERELPTKATMVLENLLWHQFVFLLDQYDEKKGGRQSFHALLPSQALDYPITMERVGTPSYQAGNETIKSIRYQLVANNALTLDMWTDEARVPLVFYNAVQQINVVRKGAESFAEAALASAPKAAEYRPPDYVARASFSEQQVTVGADSEWALPATLTLPAGKGPFPAVVLVHGSGPNDRDETQGPNKPFQDLAWGLGSQGIAVLRYDKRTLVYRGKLGALPNITVKEETVDDALAAVALLRQTPGIDPKRIFVLGHSLGGISFKSYPKLDHLFLEGTGPATNADYVRPRNIPKYVVDDIAAWIKKQR